MPQPQQEIPLRFIDGHEARAVRTGSNAAWRCRCGRELPLLGFSDTAESSSSASAIVCPQCGRGFRVIAQAIRGVPIKVAEVIDPI